MNEENELQNPQPEAAQQEAKADAPQEKAPAQEKREDKHAKHAAALAAAQAKAEEAEKKLLAAKDSLLRTAAEYDNFRKRSAKEHDAAFGNGIGFAVDALLPVLDTLVLACAAECADETYKKGVLLTLEQCKTAFEKMGVTEMEALGKAFDPALHEAVMQQPAPEGAESGTVLQVLKTGYLLKDKVLRHATVIVAE